MRQLIHVLKNTFKQPAQLLEFRHKKPLRVFGYMLFLAAILSLPIVYQTAKITQSIKEDGAKIVAKLPDFNIENGALNVDEADTGFVYQTDSIIFTFDPDGKRNKQDVENDVIGGNTMVMALLKDEAILVLPSLGTTTDVIETNSLVLPYTTPQISIITKDFINNLFTNNMSNVYWFAVIFIVTLILILFNLTIDILLLSFFAHLFTRMRGVRIKLGATYKVVVYAATVPALITAVLQFVWPGISFGTIGLALTLFIYFNALPKPPRPNKKS